jgi:hypothetical protein
MAWSIFTQGGGDQVAVGWAQQFLTALGAPVTPGNVQFIYQWEKSEGGGGKYNPLNTGPVSQHPEWTTTGQQYGGGAADYTSWDTGLMGPVYYLEHYQQATYSKILQALRNNDPVGARAALWASPWAASHYGYGATWSNATVPGGQAVLPATGGTGNGSTVDSQPVDLVASDDTCAWKFKSGIPLAGTSCLISKTQVRAILGVVLIGSAVVVGLVGAVLLVSYGFKESALGKAATDAVTTFIPGGSMVKGAAKKAAPKKTES